MTLLEILVRDWSVWNGGQRAFQDIEGDVIASDGYCFQTVCWKAEIACDRAIAVVTKAKWTARRAAVQKGQTNDQ